jgi:hypothetical protein
MMVAALAEEVAIIIMDVDILLDELIILLVELIIMLLCWFSITALGEVIIVDGVIIGAAPAVTVTTIVHGADDTIFMTGAINMHVDSGIGGGDIFDEDIIIAEDIICALASDAAARAAIIWVIMTIFAECKVKMWIGVTSIKDGLQRNGTPRMLDVKKEKIQDQLSW